MFGEDDQPSSADERDDADRMCDASSPAADRQASDRRWYDEQRPPHHDTR